MAKVGAYPSCGCGAPLIFHDIEDHVAVFGYDAAGEHPEFVEMQARWAARTIREARKGGAGQHRCGGCERFIPATNHRCGCGFANDIRGPRNHGRWVEGSSYCKQTEVPF